MKHRRETPDLSRHIATGLTLIAVALMCALVITLTNPGTM